MARRVLAAAVDAAFREFRPEHVVHLAARTDLDQDTTLDDYRANTTGTENILDSAEPLTSFRRTNMTRDNLLDGCLAEIALARTREATARSA